MKLFTQHQRFYQPPDAASAYGGPPGYGQPPQQPQPPQQAYPPQGPPANFMTPQRPEMPAAANSRAAPTPPPPKEVLPIPPEHLDLQTVFDGLRVKCLSAANHPVRNLKPPLV